MRRAVLTLGGTVAGLAALFSFRTHAPGVTPVAEPSTPAGLSVTAPAMGLSNGSSAAATATPTASPTRSATKKATPAKTPASAPATTKPAPAPATPAATHTSSAPKPPAPSGNFSGPTEQTQYGPVQVTITVTSGKITQANGNLQGQGDGIAYNAVSQLNSEVLAAQSANIQSVSGATYTSQGYTQSLQQALDQAHI